MSIKEVKPSLENKAPVQPFTGKFRDPPPHHGVPGTNFTVDWHCKTHPKYLHTFVTHAHEDHLCGIGSVRPPRSVHCSALTAKLIVAKHPQLRPCICVHEIGSEVTVENVKIHILDAGHTAGSVMFLFILDHGQGKKILHTGDLRAEDHIIDNAKIFAPIDRLYLDCTYALERFNIPPRSVVAQFIIDQVRRALKEHALVIMGTYTVGKEEIIRDVAQSVGAKVWADQTRARTLQYVFGKTDILTENKEEAKIHVAFLGGKLSASVSYARENGVSKLLSVQMTGWSAKSGWRTPEIVKIDDVEITGYWVPYSDHSSKAELLKFVEALQPINITPTTEQRKAKIDQIYEMFLPYMRRSANSRFLDFYAVPKKRE